MFYRLINGDLAQNLYSRDEETEAKKKREHGPSFKTKLSLLRKCFLINILTTIA